MKGKYEMTCDDGFKVASDDKQEVASLGAWHVMMKHPKEKMSMSDAMNKVTMAKTT
jgi:hypothetical protein